MEPSFNLIMNLNYIFLTNISYLTILKIILLRNLYTITSFYIKNIDYNKIIPR